MLTALSAASTLTIFFLLLSSRPAGGGFSRRLDNRILSEQQVIKLSDSFQYIAGITDTLVFVGSNFNPSELSIYDIRSKSLCDRIQLTDHGKGLSSGVEVSINGSFFYVFDYFNGLVSQGSLAGRSVTTTIPIGLAFSDGVAMTKRSSSLRVMDNKGGEFFLAKVDSSKIIPERDILIKQIDGKFCTDGFFNYNHKNHTLFFTYYYRNQFIAMDTNLQVKFIANTIDTISHARIKVNVSEGGDITLASPARYVSVLGATSDDCFYLSSDVPADNEDPEMFDRVFRIDCYLVATGAYQSSFYLPHSRGMKLKSFAVLGANVIAVNGKHLIHYKFSKPK